MNQCYHWDGPGYKRAVRHLFVYPNASFAIRAAYEDFVGCGNDDRVQENHEQRLSFCRNELGIKFLILPCTFVI